MGNIQTEISRISGNISAALSALTNKGVSVPSGANSDDLATLIAAIEAGGGGVTGTITPASTSALTITHGLGAQPSFFALFMTSTSAASVTTKWKVSVVIAARFDEKIQIETYSNGSRSSQTLNYKSYDPAGAFSDSIVKDMNTQTVTYSNYEGEIQVGQTYRWVVM